MLKLYRVRSKYHVKLKPKDESVTWIELVWALERGTLDNAPFVIQDVIEGYDPNWRMNASSSRGDIQNHPHKIRQLAAQELFTESESNLFRQVLSQAGHQEIRIEEVSLPLSADTRSFYWTTHSSERWYLDFGGKLKAYGLPSVPEASEISDTVFSQLKGATGLTADYYGYGVRFLQSALRAALSSLDPFSDSNTLFVCSELTEEQQGVCVCNISIMKAHHSYGGQYIKYALQMGIRPDSDASALIKAVRTLYDKHQLMVRPLSDNIPYAM